MPPADRSDERRAELLPVIAGVFKESGYRRSTTKQLAERCGLRENQLYRLWPDKKAMFLAAIEFVYAATADTWRSVMLNESLGRTAAERIFHHEVKHRGDHALYRITFAGLNEIDDSDIRKALAGMYRRFVDTIAGVVREHRRALGIDAQVDAEMAAWGLIGIGTISDITRALSLLSLGERSDMFSAIGTPLLGE